MLSIAAVMGNVGFFGMPVIRALFPDVPEAAVRVEAFLDGKACGVACFSPFTIDLGEITQAQTLELRVTNTPANELEEFLAPSGLVGGAGLLFY